MADATSAFFADLAQRGSVPALERTSGSVRFDIDHDGQVAHWRLDIREQGSLSDLELGEREQERTRQLS